MRKSKPSISHLFTVDRGQLWKREESAWTQSACYKRKNKNTTETESNLLRDEYHICSQLNKEIKKTKESKWEELIEESEKDIRGEAFTIVIQLSPAVFDKASHGKL